MDKNNLDEGVLERFMQEFFPFADFLKIGFFSKKMKNDYPAQADRVCKFFGYKTVFEYGAKPVSCHLSRVGDIPENEKVLLTVIPSIYD